MNASPTSRLNQLGRCGASSKNKARRLPGLTVVAQGVGLLRDLRIAITRLDSIGQRIGDCAGGNDRRMRRV